ncbi:cytochrome P450 [Boletus edulis BED1]|uniref:Cytochrome P450 n=1 Tax=Boletus edulis BED1 TaxID=1328754 RepID=A0AAD4C0N3_BOLED|nr:cytochrome P450 [Boletus edulis BED1]
MAKAISFVDVCLFGAGLYVIKRLVGSRRSNSLPPGPTGWPVIGNLFQISSERNWEDFAALGKKYGDISTISILGTRYVVLNSYEAISAVLEKQSSKCSNRPHLTMASDLVGSSKGLLFMDYNDRLRQHRKHFYRLFGTRSSTAAFNSIGEEETRRFVSKLLRKPEDLVDHIRSTAGAIIFKVTYGYTVQEEKDPFVELGEKVLAIGSLIATPGAFLVDFIPSLRYLPEWFPGASFLRDAKKYNQLLMDSVLKPHQYVVDQMAAGTAIPSFSSTLLEGGVSPEEEDVIMWTSMAVSLGASDTVISAIHSFFLAMILFPEVQAKAQAELDAVVGSERLPSFNDRDFLPYINAICKEVLRWHTVAPLAMPHVATEDIYYNGFLIPQGSCIIGNSWAVLHDESTYPDPEVFCPERFLCETPPLDPQNVCFGFGRRICPGKRLHLAEASLFISVAMSLATLVISKEIVNGVLVTPSFDVTSGILSHPKPFRCKITARSTVAETLLRG